MMDDRGCRMHDEVGLAVREGKNDQLVSGVSRMNDGSG